MLLSIVLLFRAMFGVPRLVWCLLVQFGDGET